MKILIVNGANLNLLGKREPDIYGTKSMDNLLQEDDYEALIINPGAYTHYSYAIADCLKNITKPKIEVHISNIYKREEFRHKSVTAPYTDAILSGFGLSGYTLAVEAIKNF